MTVGIVGLGLIGGSMAKSIKARTAHTVFGCDLDQETMMMARMCGAIDAPLTAENLKDCDLVLVAIRPAAAVKWVKEHAAAIRRVRDPGGPVRCEARGGARARPRRRAVRLRLHRRPSHGRAASAAASPPRRTDLYVGASMILTPDKRTDMQLLETLKAFFLDIGFAGLTFSDPEEHDRIIAFTSQLAHIVSSAYVKSPEAQKRRGFSAGSFQDMTRVARLDEDMWTELFLDDADYLTDELDSADRPPARSIADALKAKDAEQLRALLRDGREKKATAGGN